MTLHHCCEVNRRAFAWFALAPLALAWLNFSTHAATVSWTGSNTTWTQPDSDSFDATYNSGDTVNFTDTGVGAVTVSGGVTPAAVNVSNTAGTYTFTGGGINAGTLSKSGAGTLSLSGTNTYSGGTTLSAGQTNITSNSALGSGTLTLSGGTLYGNGTNTVPNAVSVTASTTSILLGGSGASFLGLSGNITGSGTLTLTNNGGNVRFAGNNSGFTGTINAAAATFLNSTNSGSASATWNVTTSLFVPNVAGTFHLGALTGTGTIAGQTGSSTLSIGALNQNSTFSGVINQGSVTISLIKTGTQELTLSGSNNYSGTTTISNGKLLVSNTVNTQSGVGTGDLLIDGGTLCGIGYLGLSGNATNVTFSANGGTIAPGAGPGILTVNGGVDFTSAGTANFAVELNGLVAGTNYDQLVVKSATGSTNLIDLDNATLQVALGFTPALGNQFTIIDNQISSGGITGTFLGRANNSTFQVSGTTFRINYDAGTGNDVVLTVVPEPTSFSMLLFASLMLWFVKSKRSA